MSDKKEASSHDYSTPGLWRERQEAWNEVMPGVLRRIAANSQTGTVALYKFRPGSKVAKHSHPHAQFGICLQGGGEFDIGGRTWKVGEGDGYYVPPGIEHGFLPGEKKSTRLIEFFTPNREDFTKEFLPAESS